MFELVLSVCERIGVDGVCDGSDGCGVVGGCGCAARMVRAASASVFVVKVGDGVVVVGIGVDVGNVMGWLWIGGGGVGVVGVVFECVVVFVVVDVEEVANGALFSARVGVDVLGVKKCVYGVFFVFVVGIVIGSIVFDLGLFIGFDMIVNCFYRGLVRFRNVVEYYVWVEDDVCECCGVFIFCSWCV